MVNTTANTHRVRVNPGAIATLTVQATGFGEVGVQWRRNGVDLADGGAVSGATTPTLTISPVLPADSGQYDAMLIDQCGSRTSQAAAVDVYCPADRNHDHAITPTDLAAFVNDWSASIAGVTLQGDVDGNGIVNPSDIAVFVNLWFGTIGQAC